MQTSTIRGFILGFISGITLYHVVSASIVDRTAEKVIEQMTVEVPTQQSNKFVPPVAKPIQLGMPKPTRYLVPIRHLSKADLYCLAKNIFHEAGVEDFDGKIAVGQVTFNRVDNRRWGDTVCKVVYERKQFSWTNDAKLRREIPKGPLWEESKKAAVAVMNGERIPGLETALFYHTDYIKTPSWASAEYLLTQIGDHVFYENDRKS